MISGCECRWISRSSTGPKRMALNGGRRMRRPLALLLAATATLAAAAPVRGGTLTYGRYADSLLLDPAYTDANLDILILRTSTRP